MEMIGKIRRMHLRDKLSLHEITKRTGLSRNTVRKWVRPPETMVPVYRRSDIPKKLTDFHETLERALKADALRSKHNRRTAKALFAQIKAEGYVGGYSQITRVRQFAPKSRVFRKAPHVTMRVSGRFL